MDRALETLTANGLTNAPAIITAAGRYNVPLYIAAAMIEKESGGANVYGNDRGGVFNRLDPARPADGVVTEDNYRVFLARVAAGETSNGVGPAQITWPGFFDDAERRGLRPWLPADNIAYGVSLLAGYLNGDHSDDSIIYAGQRYNGVRAYGEDLLAKSRVWERRLTDTMSKNHPITAIAALETELRKRGYDITCGPSAYRSGVCRPGRHSHLSNSTHFEGGAIDVSKDPAPGVPISVYEKAHLDDLARELMSRGFRVIWGVANHYDHLHVDYNRTGYPTSGHQVNFIGPNAGFTVAYIKAIQTDLKALGLYAGSLDGLRESGTISAIRGFQALAGLTVDGLPGNATRTELTRIVKMNAGFTVPYLRSIQTDLKTLGFYTGAIDGLRGGGTVTAIRGFQTKAGLTEDGLPGNATRAALTAAVKAGGIAPKPKPTPKPKPLSERVAPYRIAGADGWATAALLSSTTLPKGRGVLVVARQGSDLPAAVLAARGRTDVDVLPTRNGGGLPNVIADRIRAIKPSWLRVVGGNVAVPDRAAEAALKAAGINV